MFTNLQPDLITSGRVRFNLPHAELCEINSLLEIPRRMAIDAMLQIDVEQCFFFCLALDFPASTMPLQVYSPDEAT
jgi:hypothetical protein